MHKSTVLILALTMAAAITGFGLYFSQKNTSKSSSEVPTAVADLWAHWKTKNNKKYGTQDEYRLTVFYQNYLKVVAHQSNPKRTYEMSFNQFMDLTKEEFKARYLQTHVPVRAHKNFKSLSTDNLPDSVDWRTKGVVTAVKDQGQCGSCWAFSTTGSTESAIAIKTGVLTSLSEQQLVDCSTTQGNQGCEGGLMDQGFEYIIANGITTESAYPYQAVDGTCQTNGGAAHISTYTDVTSGDYKAVLAAVVLQPVSIAVDASNWQFYTSGVFSDCDANLDHGVLAVGFSLTASNGEGYIIVKNSWNASWGENGYIRLAVGNTCGLANNASYPSV